MAASSETGREPVSDEADGPRRDPNDTGNPHAALLHAAFTRENLQRALKRVPANKGAAGVGGLDIGQTSKFLITAWPAIREQLLSGTYRPSPVQRVTATPVASHPRAVAPGRHHLPRTARAGSRA